MSSTYELRKRRDRLVRQLNDNLDFLLGSVSTKGLKYPAFNLTTKVDGVTRSKHIPKDLVPLVRTRTQRSQTVKRLLKELSAVNWQLMLAGEDLRDYGTA